MQESFWFVVEGDSEKIDFKKINKREYKKKKATVKKRNEENKDIQKDNNYLF